MNEDPISQIKHVTKHMFGSTKSYFNTFWIYILILYNNICSMWQSAWTLLTLCMHYVSDCLIGTFSASSVHSSCAMIYTQKQKLNKSTLIYIYLKLNQIINDVICDCISAFMSMECTDPIFGQITIPVVSHNWLYIKYMIW